jgi:DNA-binding IclR family transcriptional regulator
MTDKIDYFSTSLEKGLRILSLFNKENKNISQTEISKSIGLNMTSTYRYINTFVALGYLEKDSQTKRLRPGIRCMSLCTNLMQATDKLKLIKSEVDKFYKEHKITIDVGLINDETMMSIYRREAEETMTYNLQVVAVNCLHNTSTGKAYLSTLSEQELGVTVSRMPLQAKTARTITNKDQLLDEIKKTKARGYSMAIEEYLPGLITIGAPLISRNSGKCLGAVSFDFSTLQTSPEELEKKYAHLIVQIGNTLSELFTDD